MLEIQYCVSESLIKVYQLVIEFCDLHVYNVQNSIAHRYICKLIYLVVTFIFGVGNLSQKSGHFTTNDTRFSHVTVYIQHSLVLSISLPKCFIQIDEMPITEDTQPQSVCVPFVKGFFTWVVLLNNIISSGYEIIGKVLPQDGRQ